MKRGGETSPVCPSPKRTRVGPRVGRTYDYNKHLQTGKTQTGYALFVNGSPYAIVDFDFKGTTDEDFMNMASSALEGVPPENIVVKTRGKGLHLYLTYDGQKDVQKGRFVGVYTGAEYTVDLLLPFPADKQSLIVLPGSKAKKNPSDENEKAGAYVYYEGYTGRFDDIWLPKTPLMKWSDYVKTNKAVGSVLQKRLNELGKPKQSFTIENLEKSVVMRYSTSPVPPEPTKKCLSQSIVNLFFGCLTNIPVHADFNKPLDEEWALYHYFGIQNWFTMYANEKISFVNIDKIMTFTENAKQQFEKRKLRYKDLVVSPFCLGKTLTSLNDEHLPRFLEIVDKIKDKLKTKDEFFVLPFDINDPYSLETFIEEFKYGEYPLSLLLSQLSRVIRWISQQNVIVLKKKDTEGNMTIKVIDPKGLPDEVRFGSFRCFGKGETKTKTLIDMVTNKAIEQYLSYFEEKKDCLCLFEGWPYEPKVNNKKNMYFDFVRNFLSKSEVDCAYIHSWVANILQNPGAKNGTIIVLVGNQGTGKTTFANIVSRLVGNYSTPNVTNVDDLTGSFNESLLSRKVFVVLNELGANLKPKSMAALKSLATEAKVRVAEKYKKAHDEENHLNILVTTNDIGIFDLEHDDRRFFISSCELPFSSNLCPEHISYFKELYEEMREPEFYERLMSFYMNYRVPVDNPPPMTPLKRVLMNKNATQLFAENLRQTYGDTCEFHTHTLYREYISFCKRIHLIPKALNNFFHRDGKELSQFFTKRRTYTDNGKLTTYCLYLPPGFERQSTSDLVNEITNAEAKDQTNEVVELPPKVPSPQI